MAATPTEILNDDVKELRGDIREIRGKIDLVKEEVQRVALAQAGMKVELVEDIQRVALTQAEMKGEFRLVKFLLMVVIAGIAGSTWRFFNLNAKVNGIESKIEKIESRIEKIESKFEGLESSLKTILEQTRSPMATQAPKGSPPGP